MVEFIADGELRPLLEKHSQPAASKKRELVVFAHTSSGGGRSRHEGLLELQKQLAQAGKKTVFVRVVGFLHPGDYPESLRYLTDGSWYTQLPAAQIPPAVALPPQVCAKAAERVLEQANHDIRHLFRANDYLRRPVVRLLLGAVVARQVSWKTANVLLKKLAEHELGNQTAIREKLDSYPVAALDNAGQSGPNFSGRTYLLVDDQVALGCYKWQESSVVKEAYGKEVVWDLTSTDAGWGPVLAAVLQSTVICGTSKDNLDRALESSLEFDAVLLDYEFGEGRQRGGDFLADIKNAQFDLPVVIFSVADDASIARWTFAHGASGYYVKETEEAEGRSSITAYSNLLEVVGRLQPFEHCARRLWREWILLEGKLQAMEANAWKLNQSVDPPSVSRNILQALKHMLLMPVAVNPADLVGQGLAVHIDAAMEELARCKFLSTGASGNWSSRSDNILGVAWHRTWPRPIRLCLGMDIPSVERVRPGKPKTVPTCYTKATWQAISAAAHARQAPSLEVCTSALNELLEAVKTATSDAGKVSAGIRRVPAPSENAPEPAVTRTGNHATANKLGADDIKQSIKKHRCGSSDLCVLFWDSAGSSSGWNEALKRLFGEKTQFCDSKPDWNEVNRCVDVVLLGLKMPAARDGLDALRQLRINCPAVPVIMLTAANTSVATWQALELGAADFFLKLWARKNERDDCAKNLHEIVCEQAKRSGVQSYARKTWFEAQPVSICTSVSENGFGCRMVANANRDVREAILAIIRSYESCLGSTSAGSGVDRTAVDRAFGHLMYWQGDPLSVIPPARLALATGAGILVETLLLYSLPFSSTFRRYDAGEPRRSIEEVWRGCRPLQTVADELYAERNKINHGERSDWELDDWLDKCATLLIEWQRWLR